MNIFQIIITLISLVMIGSGTFRFYKKENNQTFLKFTFTLLVWFVIMFFSLFPEQSHEISKKLGMGDNLNTLIFLVFVVIFLILFKIINIIERIEKNISEMVRDEALKSIRDRDVQSSNKGPNNNPVDFEENIQRAK